MLVSVAKYTVRGGYRNDSEDLEDIVLEALEKLLDYFQRKPEKLLVLEDKDPAAMSNYLKKSMRNHVLNVLKRKNREKRLESALTSDLVREVIRGVSAPAGRLRPCPIPENLFIEDTPTQTGSAEGPASVNRLKRDIHAFIESRYAPRKWDRKKHIIDLFFERFERNLSLTRIQALHPGKNIPSLNAEANRILKKYRVWTGSGNGVC